MLIHKKSVSWIFLYSYLISFEQCCVLIVCLYHHRALGLSGEWLPNSHHLLMRFAGRADDLHVLALD